MCHSTPCFSCEGKQKKDEIFGNISFLRWNYVKIYIFEKHRKMSRKGPILITFQELQYMSYWPK
jgi:hypothetical protein